MKKFKYKSYDSSGSLKQGEIHASDSESAKSKLKESGLIPVNISEASKEISRGNKYFNLQFKPGINQVEALTSRLSLLLKNGIKVDKSIELVIKGIQNKKLKQTLIIVRDDIRRGLNLSDSLSKYPEIFDSMYISMVRVGEKTGNLSNAFADISNSLNFHKTILSKTQQALLYPLVILFVCLGSILFIFNFIVPKFSVMFDEISELPFYTKLLLSLSDFFSSYQYVVIPTFLFIGGMLYLNKDRNTVKQIKYFFSAHVPIVKQLSYTLENLRFASALSMLLSSGIVLSEALKHAVDSVSNTFIKKKLSLVKKRVRQGEALSDLLADSGFWPERFDGLVEIGEQTGNLAEVFKEVELRLKDDYEKAMTGLITLIEPLLIIIMGLIVGSVIVILFLSMVTVNDIAF